MAELRLADTVGILRRPGLRPRHTSAGLGWDRLYLSAQQERPYRAEFDPAPTHLLILHLNGPVTVRRGTRPGVQSRTVPAGGLFLQPAGRTLAVELTGNLDTIHAYLADEALHEANEGRPVELSEELGATDPLAEQLMLALDTALRRWEPSARTYIDHLTGALAAQLVHRHAAGVAAPRAGHSGLSTRQLDAVRELMEQRLDEPLPIAELATVAALSPSQFTRRFRASTGQSPHQFLLKLRLDHACRLLRTGSDAIGQVAVECGFSHQEHLTRVMRAKLGTTPAALRRAG
ncbi:helix-turn-helix domain-containing protein [Streptomyces olivochromogenes]|uniref:helix-turn-helix domain-containing protein n=1 Tax=Streptomyces olivochromogenes TaxID=1963 RepID=UPI001F46F63A|nr:AraC family transcriptional regulator [Streptomyces olivochromogenes]MCF3128992.1 helix-turn-helix transcriptional regulator [Streptomyces olivochromogenes]